MAAPEIAIVFYAHKKRKCYARKKEMQNKMKMQKTATARQKNLKKRNKSRDSAKT